MLRSSKSKLENLEKMEKQFFAVRMEWVKDTGRQELFVIAR